MESDQQEKGDKLMFAQWIAAGAAFGIQAFFAVLVFALCAGVVLGLLAALGALYRRDDQ